MSRELITSRGALAAEWVDDDRHLIVPSLCFSPDEAQALAAFIAAGPPKARWRITRTFEEKPREVWMPSGTSSYKATILTDADLEEVWGDE